MKFLLVFMIWSQGICFASAAASSSAAADEKGVAARKNERKPEIPEAIAKDLAQVSITGNGMPDVAKAVTQWLMEDPNNKNGVYREHNGRSKSLLVMVISAYATALEAPELLRIILDLEPDVNFIKEGRMVPGPEDALGAILTHVGFERSEHMAFIKKIINLVLSQGGTPQEIEGALQIIGAPYQVPDEAAAKHNWQPTTIGIYTYISKMINAALEYIRDIHHDMQAADVLEEELTRHLGGRGVRPVGRTGADYLRPVKKKAGKKLPSVGESSDAE